ncbi:hypothetical protein HK097_010769 [Rhizophlyctis rosea]|uniref:Uncharacterized protein n=1 Tax=Rhizophlyctis rosea TaxID=64517 RepID=A0AAD5S8K4_9FUNG|nr:hypothetical protein HK097_010769 [Rhizophlyctis rosea]
MAPKCSHCQCCKGIDESDDLCPICYSRIFLCKSHFNGTPTCHGICKYPDEVVQVCARCHQSTDPIVHRQIQELRVELYGGDPDSEDALSDDWHDEAFDEWMEEELDDWLFNGRSEDSFAWDNLRQKLWCREFIQYLDEDIDQGADQHSEAETNKVKQQSLQSRLIEVALAEQYEGQYVNGAIETLEGICGVSTVKLERWLADNSTRGPKLEAAARKWRRIDDGVEL